MRLRQWGIWVQTAGRKANYRLAMLTASKILWQNEPFTKHISLVEIHSSEIQCYLCFSFLRPNITEYTQGYPGVFVPKKTIIRTATKQTRTTRQGWAGKVFWLPGTGREIENHIPVLREGNKKIAFPFFGKGNLSSQYLYIGWIC